MPLRLLLLAAAGGAALAAAIGMSLAAEPSAPSPTAEQIIAARQASYDLSVMAMAEMQQALKDGTDIKKQAYAANSVARWAKVLPTLFPAGTEKGATPLPTKARPEIWSNRADFEKAAANYATEAGKLADLARAADTDGFAAQLKVVSKACDACHDKFKAE